MKKEEKDIILKVQSVIDLILEKQNTYAIDRDLMYKLSDLFETDEELFTNNFSVNYLNFIENFSLFFDTLIIKLKEYENDLIETHDSLNDCIFNFTFKEFNEKESLIPYIDMIYALKEMFPKNTLLQGVVFYLHLNTLLKRYKFQNNKINVDKNNVIIDIDYADRISYYREIYITNFRHELEEGIRNGVFLDEEEIPNYVVEEIKQLERELSD